MLPCPYIHKEIEKWPAHTRGVLSRGISVIHACSGHVEHEFDSSVAAAVAMTPSDSGFGPRQRRHLIRAQLVYQLIRVQLVLLD